MTEHNMTQAWLGRTARHAPSTFLDRSLERLLALVHEWRIRRNLRCSLGRLSDGHLRDLCLTKDDVEAACADSLDRPAHHALETAARSRLGNW